ncbi:GntR family transcriptional regulator [Microlunatus sp. Y2014]|uniref:GntR family transcriptional regulator n=1 Tax=Microlunatus sp. Y2014 TaxID=3418488 RepID=UPI003DA78D5C
MTKSDRVRDGVRADIVSGALVAGAVLDEVALAEQYEVSRTPVREALRSLAADGLLVGGPRRQQVVVDVTQRHRDEITVLRTALEQAAVDEACRRVTDDDLDGLHLMLIRQRRMAEAGDAASFLSEDERFHKSFSEVARMPLLSRFLEQLGPFVRLARLDISTDRTHLAGLVVEHEQLVELLEAGESVALRTALAEHIGNTARRG